MSNKILNITHADIDGAACTILLKQYFGKDKVEAVPIPFNRADVVCTKAIEEWSSKFKAIFVTDVYPSKEIAERFKGTNIYMYNHHESGIPKSKNCIIIPKQEYSAALVVASKLIGIDKLDKQTKALVFLTTDYDSYKLSDKRSRFLNLLYFGKYTFESYVNRFITGFDAFTNSEKTYIDNVEAEIASLKKEVPNELWCWNFGGYKVSACTIYNHMNDITDHMFELEPLTDIAIALRVEQRKGSVRLRSTKENDIHEGSDFNMQDFVTNILKVKGGGHKFSGGFTWAAQDEVEGIPPFMVEFRRWNKTLKKNNFYKRTSLK